MPCAERVVLRMASNRLPSTSRTNGISTVRGRTRYGRSVQAIWLPTSMKVASNAITGATNPSFNSALANNPELVRWFFQEVYTKQTQKLFVADAVFNGELGIELAGGNIGWAAGAQFLVHEAMLGMTIDGARGRLQLDRPYLPPLL